MTDLPDDQPDTDDIAEPAERLALPTLDSFAAVRDLIALCIDPRAVKRHLRQLHDALAATAAAQRQLENDRAEHDRVIAAERAEIAAERDALMKRRVDVHQAEASLAERTERITRLERAWSDLTLPGEPPPLMGTLTRSKAYTGLERARYAATHDGALPTHPDALPLEGEPQAEPPPAPVRRGHGDAGDWPKNVTLTRSPEEPPAGARVRPGRKGAATPAATPTTPATP